MRIDLRENGDAMEVQLDTSVGIALAASAFVDAQPLPGSPLWLLRPTSKVGAVRVGPLEVHVTPKVDVARVIFLLGFSHRRVAWRDDLVSVGVAPDLMTALADAFSRLAERSLQQGLIQGYRTVDESLQVVRGRIREAEQIRRRFGMPIPVEVRYDDFTPDTPENRLLRAAVLRLRRLPGLPQTVRHRLLRLDLRLSDVTPVSIGSHLEDWVPSRLNARYHDALRLAEIVIRSSSFEPGGDGLAVNGFIVDMAKVFEDFVCAALGSRLRMHGGETQNQDPWHLDVDREVRMLPDLVWYADDPGTPTAVVDAKYKAEKPSGFPDADLYQMLAYCTALGLPRGHLVYAKGNEEGKTHRVTGTDVTIRAHTLDLATEPAALLRQIDTLGDLISEEAVVGAMGGAV